MTVVLPARCGGPRGRRHWTYSALCPYIARAELFEKLVTAFNEPYFATKWYPRLFSFCNLLCDLFSYLALAFLLRSSKRTTIVVPQAPPSTPSWSPPLSCRRHTPPTPKPVRRCSYTVVSFAVCFLTCLDRCFNRLFLPHG